jgi:oxalate decarboxylase/phosphoglucose isomerase-like protein (cupin superfamily)
MTTVIDESIFASSVKSSLWECPVWHQKTPFTEKFNKELLKEMYEIASTFDESSGKESLLDYDRPCMQELIDFKTEVITNVVNQYMPTTQRAEFVVSGAWLNVNTAGERIELHAHPDSSIACSYYIQGPDVGGEFYYVDTGRVGKHQTEIKTITPKNGDMIFLPSYVLHGVKMNLGRCRVNLTTDFKHDLTKDSKDRLVLKSFINSMLRIKDL